jgi:hypothetical protein
MHIITIVSPVHGVVLREAFTSNSAHEQLEQTPLHQGSEFSRRPYFSTPSSVKNDLGMMKKFAHALSEIWPYQSGMEKLL